MKLPLLAKIIIAIVLGVGAAYVLPIWGTRVFVTFQDIFSQYLGFIVPLLILGFVAPSIAEMGGKAGKILLATVALAYAFTLLSGFTSYFTAATVFPSLLSIDEYIAAENGADTIQPFFSMEMTPLMGVLSALILAFVLGLGAAKTGARALVKGLDEFRDIIVWIINKSIIPLLPLYIFSIFLGMTAEGKVWSVLGSFASIIVVIFLLHIFVLLMQYCIAGIIARKNPLKALWGMMPAYFTALGTSSSAATIPVTLKRAEAIGVDPDVAGFTIPLCATVHLSGSTLKIVACALALMITQGMPYDFSMFAGFIAMLGVTMVAAPGVPGGAIMAALGVLTSILGFSSEANALMIALYIAMDSFGTACNVTGDGAVSLIINKFFKKQ